VTFEIDLKRFIQDEHGQSFGLSLQEASLTGPPPAEIASLDESLRVPHALGRRAARIVGRRRLDQAWPKDRTLMQSGHGQSPCVSLSKGGGLAQYGALESQEHAPGSVGDA
jgi:hypothetical protein